MLSDGSLNSTSRPIVAIAEIFLHPRLGRGRLASQEFSQEYGPDLTICRIHPKIPSPCVFSREIQAEGH